MARPTPNQINFLRKLSQERGVTFAWPETFDDASKQIDRLKKIRRSPRHERRQDYDAVTRDRMDTGTAGFRDHEITGYGSTARWS